MKLGHQHRGHNYVLNVKALVDAFNQEKALVGTFSVDRLQHYYKYI